MLKLYEIQLTPTSMFGTELVGDTLFGHLCCQFVADERLLNCPFSELVASYSNNPFLVISSAFIRVKMNDCLGYAIPRPELALFGSDKGHGRKEEIVENKKRKKKKHLFLPENLVPLFSDQYLLSDAEIAEGINNFNGQKTCNHRSKESVELTRNTINRQTGTTGTGKEFSPYPVTAFSWHPGTKLSLFALLDESICTVENLKEAISRIGAYGYGKDASSGFGKFTVEECTAKTLPQIDGANSLFTLSPSVPSAQEAVRAWFQPITRFGKHGAGIGSTPFKNPVVMAETGAVFQNAEQTIPQQPYVGSAITGVSKAIPDTIVQGYAIALPCFAEAQS